MLGENRLSDILLERDILRDLRLEQRLATTPFGEIDRKHRVFRADRHLPSDLLLPIGAPVERQLHGHRVSRHLAEGFVDEDAVGAGEGLAGDVAFPLGGVRRIGRNVGVGQECSTGRRPRGCQGADRAGRFLDNHVDVGIAVPGKLNLDVTDEGFVDRTAERLGLFHLPLLLEAGDRGLRQPRGSGRHLLLACRPFVGKHPRTRPLERGDVVFLGGERHRQSERLAV